MDLFYEDGIKTAVPIIVLGLFICLCIKKKKKSWRKLMLMDLRSSHESSSSLHCISAECVVEGVYILKEHGHVSNQMRVFSDCHY